MHVILTTPLASTVNAWRLAEWLKTRDRLRAPILVQSQQPEMAAREIDRVGDYAGLVQSNPPMHSLEPYGDRRFPPTLDGTGQFPIVSRAVHDACSVLIVAGTSGFAPR